MSLSRSAATSVYLHLQVTFTIYVYLSSSRPKLELTTRSTGHSPRSTVRIRTVSSHVTPPAHVGFLGRAQVCWTWTGLCASLPRSRSGQRLGGAGRTAQRWRKPWAQVRRPPLAPDRHRAPFEFEKASIFQDPRSNRKTGVPLCHAVSCHFVSCQKCMPCRDQNFCVSFFIVLTLESCESSLEVCAGLRLAFVFVSFFQVMRIPTNESVHTHSSVSSPSDFHGSSRVYTPTMFTLRSHDSPAYLLTLQRNI